MKLRFDDILLLKFGSTALAVLAGLTPELTALVFLFARCGGMGTGPLKAAGEMGSISLGCARFEWTANN